MLGLDVLFHTVHRVACTCPHTQISTHTHKCQHTQMSQPSIVSHAPPQNPQHYVRVPTGGQKLAALFIHKAGTLHTDKAHWLAGEGCHRRARGRCTGWCQTWCTRWCLCPHRGAEQQARQNDSAHNGRGFENTWVRACMVYGWGSRGH